jgi:hypothetical protein
VDHREVAPGADRGGREERDQEAGDEAPARRGRSRHRPAAGRYEECDEDPEPDEVTEREVDDSRQPVDQRVPDRQEPVDAAGGEAGEHHLEGQIHRRSVSPVVYGFGA